MRTALLTATACLAAIASFGACGGPSANDGPSGWGGSPDNGGGGTGSEGTSSGATSSVCNQCATDADCQSSCGDAALYCCYVATPGSMGTCYSLTSSGCPASPSTTSSRAGSSGSSSGGLGGLGASNGFGGSGGFGGFDASSAFGGLGGFGGFGGFDASSAFGGFGASSGFGGFGAATSSSGGARAGAAGSSGTGSGSGSTGGGSTSNSSGTGSSSGSGAGGSTPSMLPHASGACPTFSNGSTVTVTAGAGSIQAKIWMGSSAAQGGPLILYWHGTGSSPGAEVPIAFDTSAVASAGGMIAGFISSSRTGTPTGNTGDAVWYESDATFADQVVACAIQQLAISPRRIHSAGYSAGALQTVYMWYARSGYLASVISYSGGDATINKAAAQDPSNVPAAIAAHGAMGSDAVGIDFASASATWESEIKAQGGFSIDCNDGGNHLDFFRTRAPGLEPVSLQFFLDHPFKAPNAYTTLPSGFPSYCHID